MSERPTASVLVTGSELLTGHVADANGPFVARALGDLGFAVRRVILVGDRPDDLRSALDHVSGEDLVVTSGGLGPTADDLTAEIVAEYCAAPMAVDPALRDRIHAKVAGWAKRAGWAGPALDAATAKQARVPHGAEVLEPVGTAPGLVVSRGGGPVVVVLPGPPRELTGMWPAVVAAGPVATLLERAPRAEAIRLRFAGIPESDIAATLREIGADLDLARVEIITCLRRSELEADLHPLPGAEGIAREAADRIVAAHRRKLISDDGSTTDELLAAALLERGWTVATGESCTGGLLAGRLVDRAGSSAYVAGGVVAYSNEAKTAQLDVPADLIAEHGAVSPEVARALADGARARFGTDVGVGITGVAGPDGGTEAKPVGYVCFCVTTADGQVISRDPQFPGGRTDVRERSVDLAMHLLLRATGRTGAGAHR